MADDRLSEKAHKSCLMVLRKLKPPGSEQESIRSFMTCSYLHLSDIYLTVK